MFALFQIIALCAAAAVAPNYTVLIREQTAPERAVRMPLVGSVCILDAVEALKRSPRDLARMDLWIERVEGGELLELRVDWVAISHRGMTATNYQILAGDRLFLQVRPAK
jgi:hypothetical protein